MVRTSGRIQTDCAPWVEKNIYFLGTRTRHVRVDRSPETQGPTPSLAV